MTVTKSSILSSGRPGSVKLIKDIATVNTEHFQHKKIKQAFIKITKKTLYAKYLKDIFTKIGVQIIFITINLLIIFVISRLAM